MRRFERVGGEKTLTVDVRLLAATNKDLKLEVEKGTFREDLFYRLNVIPILLPPLPGTSKRHPFTGAPVPAALRRGEGQGLGGPQFRGHAHAPGLLLAGYVRELENSIEHAVVLAKSGRLEPWDLPLAVQRSAPTPSRSLADRELQTLLAILEECGWNKKQAAQRLGISRSTIYAILKRHNISNSGPPPIKQTVAIPRPRRKR